MGLQDWIEQRKNQVVEFQRKREASRMETLARDTKHAREEALKADMELELRKKQEVFRAKTQALKDYKAKHQPNLFQGFGNQNSFGGMIGGNGIGMDIFPRSVTTKKGKNGKDKANLFDNMGF
jgi:hypothetical protein